MEPRRRATLERDERAPQARQRLRLDRRDGRAVQQGEGGDVGVENDQAVRPDAGDGLGDGCVSYLRNWLFATSTEGRRRWLEHCPVRELRHNGDAEEVLGDRAGDAGSTGRMQEMPLLPTRPRLLQGLDGSQCPEASIPEGHTRRPQPKAQSISGEDDGHEHHRGAHQG